MWVVPGSFVIGVLTTGIVSYLFKPLAELSMRNLTLERKSVQ
jgi:hypothetical protein